MEELVEWELEGETVVLGENLSSPVPLSPPQIPANWLSPNISIITEAPTDMLLLISNDAID
jgi:hypothetical protein